MGQGLVGGGVNRLLGDGQLLAWSLGSGFEVGGGCCGGRGVRDAYAGRCTHMRLRAWRAPTSEAGAGKYLVIYTVAVRPSKSLSKQIKGYTRCEMRGKAEDKRIRPDKYL